VLWFFPQVINNGVVSYPANSNPNILTVGAISQCGQRKSPTSCDNESTWGSNFGATLDVMAPGVLIPTTDRTSTNGYNPNLPIHTINNGNHILTDYTNNDYTVWFNGTSSACPHVAGVAALMLSVNPSLTGQQVRDIIEQTAQKVGGYNYTTTTGRTNGTWHNDMGYGLVNALCAVSYAQMSLTWISGPDVVSEFFSFYSAQNLPPGCSVSWNQSDNLIRRCTQGSVFCEFVPSDSFPAPGWIEATITNPCGSITLPRKTVWLGVPDYSKLSIELQNGHLTSCNYTSGTAKYLNAPWPGIDAYEWYMPNASNWTIEEEALSGITNKYVEIYYWENPAPSYEDIYIRAHNRSGWSEWQHTSWPTVSCNGYLMILSPNPVTDEATIKLVNKKDNTPIEFTEWDYEIYDSMQGMKEKKTKLKSAETKINTSGWKDGIYIIRAMIDKELVTGKLVVKH
jgi:hypothetical protein